MSYRKDCDGCRTLREENERLKAKKPLADSSKKFLLQVLFRSSLVLFCVGAIGTTVFIVSRPVPCSNSFEVLSKFDSKSSRTCSKDAELSVMNIDNGSHLIVKCTCKEKP